MMRELKVPYAFDSAGRVIAPLAAAKGAHYTCLECDKRLDLKRSSRERPYFAHRPDAFGACSGESATHLAAKHLLKAQLEEPIDKRITAVQDWTNATLVFLRPGYSREEVLLGAITEALADTAFKKPLYERA